MRVMHEFLLFKVKEVATVNLSNDPNSVSMFYLQGSADLSNPNPNRNLDTIVDSVEKQRYNSTSNSPNKGVQ